MGKQFRFIMSDEDKERFICKALENGKVYYKKITKKWFKYHHCQKQTGFICIL